MSETVIPERLPDDRACAAVVGSYLGKPVICGVPLTVHMSQTYTHAFVPAPQNGSTP